VIGYNYRDPAHHQRMKNLLQDQHRLIRRSPKDDAVWPVEVFHRATRGKKHGLGDDGSAEACLFDAVLDGVSSAHSNRRDYRKYRRLGSSARNAQRQITEI